MTISHEHYCKSKFKPIAYGSCSKCIFGDGHGNFALGNYNEITRKSSSLVVVIAESARELVEWLYNESS